MWLGPAWADRPDLCAAMGQVAYEAARARAMGVPLEAALAELRALPETDATTTLRALVRAEYAAPRPPDQARAETERVCRGR